MFISFVIIILILTFLHIWIRYRRYARLFNKIPGPKPLPFFGNLLSFNIPSDQIWIKMHGLQEINPVYRLWSVYSGLVLTRDPDHVKAILSSKININKEVNGYTNIRCGGNNGIVVSAGKLWEHRRKILNQAFSVNVLEMYFNALDNRARKFTKDLLSQEKIAIHDVSQMSMKFAFDVVCEATMGFDMDTALEKKGRQFRDAFIEIGEICYHRVSRRYIKDWMMHFLPIGIRQKKLWKILNEFAGKVIDDRRKYHESVGASTFKEYFDNIEKGIFDNKKVQAKNLSVVDVLLLSEQKGLIGRQGILDETILMIAAGFETTGIAIMFLILLLAENKDAQELAREELLNVVGSYDNEITMEHIKKLDYLERCAKESMRLFTVTPFTGRSLEEDMKLGEYTIPVGTEVFISVFDLHRDPNLWPNPNKFDPDRFLPDNVKQQHPYAYIPFSKGPRGCIGSKLGMKEIKTVVAHILHNFYLDPIDRTADFKFSLGVTLQVESARVKFTKINEKN